MLNDACIPGTAYVFEAERAACRILWPMALPPRLWLPETPLESAGTARSLGKGPSITPAIAGLWTPLPGGSLAFGVTNAGGASGSTPRVLMSVASADLPRVRRRALWRGEAGLPDLPVLVEWFPIGQLASERSAAQRVRGVCHAQLLRLIAIGPADARSGFAVSEASDGVDLATVARAAPGELPAWWAIHVIAQLTRAVQFLIDVQQRRGLPCVGHGRISANTVFVGWNGSVQLLAFSAASGSGRGDETLAPELRASERLLTPAADVYALAVLLRQLLPSSALMRPATSRLLRRALHSQADQRLALPAFCASLQALLLDLQAPLFRAQALGEILGRFCPRASVDLLETDWGESTGDGLAALPPSLAPLSASPVSLSPTWYQRIAPPAAVAPVQPRLRRLLSFLAALGLVCVGLLVISLTWLSLSSRPLVTSAPQSPPPPNAASSIAAVRPVEPPWPAALTVENADAFSGLRLELGRMEPRSARESTQAVAWVHLSNPGRTAQTVDLRALRVRNRAGQILRPILDLDVAAAAQVSVGAGRRLSRRLAFVPEVSDTAGALPAPAESTLTQRPTPNASSTR